MVLSFDPSWPVLEFLAVFVLGALVWPELLQGAHKLILSSFIVLICCSHPVSYAACCTYYVPYKTVAYMQYRRNEIIDHWRGSWTI